MPTCRRSYCSREAVPGAVKRFCTEHLAEYNGKRKEHLKVYSAKCVNCNRAIKPCDNDLCNTCENKIQKDIQARNEAFAYQQNKHLQLRESKTVEELKEWIFKYMI